MAMGAPSATKVAEKQLMRWAFGANGLARHLVPWRRDGREHLIALEVGAPVLPTIVGQSAELDALIWPIENPAEAIVIEAKRLRVDGSTLQTEQIGGLQGIREVVQQASAHVARGFARVYIALFIAVDSRSFSGEHWLGGGLPPELRKRIIEATETAMSEKGIGALVFELDQPVDKDVQLAGGFGLIHSRLAPVRMQPNEITDRIRRLSNIHHNAAV